MHKYLDLRGTPCPLNFVRCCLELEKLKHHHILQVDIDRGEPEEMVLSGLCESGHNVNVILRESDWIRFTVIPNANEQ